MRARKMKIYLYLPNGELDRDEIERDCLRKRDV